MIGVEIRMLLVEGWGGGLRQWEVWMQVGQNALGLPLALLRAFRSAAPARRQPGARRNQGNLPRPVAAGPGHPMIRN